MKDTMVKSYECPICHEEITAEKLAILPEDEHELHEELLGNIGDHMFSCHEAKRTPDAEQLEARIAELEKPILCAKCNDHIIADDGAVCEICADTMDTIITELQARITSLEAENLKVKTDNAFNKDAFQCFIDRIHKFEADAKNMSLGIEYRDARIAELETENAKLRASAVVWHKYPAEKPPESGIEYLVLIDGEIPRLAVYGHHVLYEDDTMNKWYSDEGPAKEPVPYGETEITHWAYLPDMPEEEK